MQNGKQNCTCATGEMGIKAQGGNYTQNDIRSWMGGDPNLKPLKDVYVVRNISDKTGLSVEGIQNGKMLGYASKSDYITSSLKSGRSVHMTIPGNSNIAHSVSVKGSYLKYVTKINGSLKTSIAHRIFDPARINPYYKSASYVNRNAITIFSMWR